MNIKSLIIREKKTVLLILVFLSLTIILKSLKFLELSEKTGWYTYYPLDGIALFITSWSIVLALFMVILILISIILISIKKIRIKAIKATEILLKLAIIFFLSFLFFSSLSSFLTDFVIMSIPTIDFF